MDMRKEVGGKKFLIKWVGYPHFSHTWEVEDNILDPELIPGFLASRNKDQMTKKLL